MDIIKNLFKGKKKKTNLIFIIEDDPTYSKLLVSSLKISFPEKEMVVFPVGETCLPEMHRNPDVVIVDYFLNSEFRDAESGLEIIKEIRKNYPEMNIVLLSGQKEFDVVIESVRDYHCTYVKKDTGSLSRVEEVIKEI
jgi:ActR/RegA family two-component response regulator